MFIYKLKPIKNKMIENNQIAISFNFKYNEENLTIIFFVLEQMIISFINNTNNKFISLEIKKDFSIETSLNEEDYKNLITLLNIKFSKETPFSPSCFFFEFSKNIPTYEETREEIARKKIKYVSNFIDDIKNTSLIGKNDHNKDKKIVSIKNLNKTTILLGRELAINNKKNNISTIWGPYKNNNNN